MFFGRTPWRTFSYFSISFFCLLFLYSHYRHLIFLYCWFYQSHQQLLFIISCFRKSVILISILQLYRFIIDTKHKPALKLFRSSTTFSPSKNKKMPPAPWPRFFSLRFCVCCAKSSALNAEPKRRFGDEVPEEAAVAETTEAVRRSGGMTPWVGMGLLGVFWSMRRMRTCSTSHYLGLCEIRQ